MVEQEFIWSDGYSDYALVQPDAPLWRRTWTSRQDCRVENSRIPDFGLRRVEVSITITTFRRELLLTPTGRIMTRFVEV